MYSVSENYKQQMNKTVRNLSYIKVNFGIVNSDASNKNNMSDNGHLHVSDLNEVGLGKNVDKRYLTFERNKFVLDGKGLLPQENNSPYYQGFVGADISSSTGTFTTAPTITVNFELPYSFIGLTFRFNKIFNSYPSIFQIIGYNGASIVYNKTVNPTGFDFILDEQIPEITKMELKFNKMAIPYRRAELEYIMFGIVATFTEDSVTDSTWTRSIDLLSTALPKNEFEFTVLDPNRNYNPENPTGVWRYLEDRQPIWFQYGYELDNGEIEWVNGSNLYSNGDVKVNSNNILSTVTFSSESILSSLEDDYYKGVYNPNGRSLYDLAIDVFTFANLPLLSGGIIPYKVDIALQSIITKVPLPQAKVKEVLQLIANAGRCVLQVNRIGQIEITRINQESTGFKLDFSNIKSAPVLDKSPYLLSVDTFSTTVTIASEAIKVHSSSIDFNVATECFLTHDMSTDTSLGIGAGVSVIGSPQYYANGCLVTLQGTGEIQVIGKKLIFSKKSIVYNAGITGFRCPIENILLNNDADAYSYAEWIASILTKRNMYTVQDRGYPEIDMLDLITADTLFTQNMSSTIVSNKITFNGTLSGETKYIANEVI